MKLFVIGWLVLLCPPVGIALLLYGHIGAKRAKRRAGERSESVTSMVRGLDIAEERARRPLWPRDWSRPDAYCGTEVTP